MKSDLKVYNIKDKIEYLEEVVILEHNEWASNPVNNTKQRIEEKINKIKGHLPKNNFCKLVLLNKEELVGFISIFPHDSDALPELTPWYSTMYVKKEYRGKGYSKILHEAILEEARQRGFNYLYLKTDLSNYYEKFGAEFIKNIDEEEKLYRIDLNK